MISVEIRPSDRKWLVFTNGEGLWLHGRGVKFPVDFPMEIPHEAVFYREDAHKWYYYDAILRLWSELSGGGIGSLTIQENDGVPSVVGVDTLIIDQDDGMTLTDLGDGDVRLDLVNFDSDSPGTVPASGGGTTDFLRADGSWAAPPGGAGADEEARLLAFIALFNRGL